MPEIKLRFNIYKTTSIFFIKESVSWSVRIYSIRKIENERIYQNKIPAALNTFGLP